MCVTLIGGMDRLKPEYETAAKERGHSIKCISRNENNFTGKIGIPDIIIVFTGKISHEARHKALRHAKINDIPIKFVHSCGLSTLKQCLIQSENSVSLYST